MELDAVLRWLEATSMATAIREGASYFPWIEALHVLAIVVVVGSIAILDLRLLGLASKDRSVERLMADTLPCSQAAFAVAATTGALLFCSRAIDYAHNPYLQLKLVFLVLAGINVALFHLLGSKGLQIWGTPPNRTPLRAKIAGGASLLLWIGVIVCGRWIGFTLTRAAAG